MNTAEFPAPVPGAGITSQIELNRSKPKLLRNSRILLWMAMSLSIAGVFLAACMVLMAFSLVFPLSDFTLARVGGIVNWAAGALVMSSLCFYLWSLVRPMAGYKVYLDSRGVNFSLGTKKAPAELFKAWDQISAVKTKRAGMAQQYWVEAKDGSEARFSSYVFLRPRKVARTIAKRAGLAIQKG